MINKVCNKCGETKEIEQFPADSSHSFGVRNTCKICYCEQIKPRMNKMRNRRREIIQEAKNKPCLDCGGIFPPYVMDFDHARGIKRFDISQAIGSGKSDAKILKEIKKCDVVCSNCHRIRSFKVGHIRQPGANLVSRGMSQDWKNKLSKAQTGKRKPRV